MKFCLRSSVANISSWNRRRVSKRRVGYDQQYYFYYTQGKEYFRTRVRLMVPEIIRMRLICVENTELKAILRKMQKENETRGD